MAGALMHVTAGVTSGWGRYTCDNVCDMWLGRYTCHFKCDACLGDMYACQQV